MKEPKKKQEVLNDFQNVLKEWLITHNARPTDQVIWENNINDFVKECTVMLQTSNQPIDAKTIVEKLYTIPWIYINSRIQSVTIASLNTVLNPILDDWYLNEEEMEWLKVNNLSNDPEYV